jgi:hypothetical protein
MGKEVVVVVVVVVVWLGEGLWRPVGRRGT